MREVWRSCLTTVLGISMFALASCGGSDGQSGSGGISSIPSPTPSPAPSSPGTPTPTPTGAAATTAAVAAATTIDFQALMNYAAPVLPAYYDGTIPEDSQPHPPIDDRIATLGRALFYDKRLSTDDSTSCSSCHRQTHGFSDPRPLSTGIAPATNTLRHSMRLGNMRYFELGFMRWTRDVDSIEAQTLLPIQNPIELGWSNAKGGTGALITKMNAIPYYPDLFAFAFGDPMITTDRISNALTQFLRAIISSHSKFDTGYATVFDRSVPGKNILADFPNFTPEENRGKKIFVNPVSLGGGGCSICHQPPSFAISGAALNNGLDAGASTRFKSPPLKNIGFGPYMHDGRFATLEDVVEFYDRMVQDGPLLDPRMVGLDGKPLKLNLSAADKAALVAFMKTLDDPVLASDPRFSDPFRH